MKIFASKQQSPAQRVNSLGKYLFKNLPGAIDFKKSSNMFDVYTIVLYQIPYDIIKKYDITEEKYKEVYEMTININLTTYSNKIRVNFIELTPEELTLGHHVYDHTKYPTFKPLKDDILWYLEDRLSRRYEDYDFLF